MSDSDLYIQVPDDDTEGHAIGGVVSGGDEEWIRQQLGRGGESSVALRPSDEDDDDVEGHAAGASVKLRAFESDDDTEGHSISLSFPSRADAEAFRKRLMLAGVLTGTIALGAAGGVGLASLGAPPAETGARAGAAAAGMDWSQAERPDQAAAGAGAGSAAGMDWSQAERPDQAAAGAGAGSAAGMDWSQAERPDQAAAAEPGDVRVDRDGVKRGPTPE